MIYLLAAMMRTRIGLASELGFDPHNSDSRVGTAQLQSDHLPRSFWIAHAQARPTRRSSGRELRVFVSFFCIGLSRVIAVANPQRSVKAGLSAIALRWAASSIPGSPPSWSRWPCVRKFGRAWLSLRSRSPNQSRQPTADWGFRLSVLHRWSRKNQPPETTAGCGFSVLSAFFVVIGFLRRVAAWCSERDEIGYNSMRPVVRRMFL